MFSKVAENKSNTCSKFDFNIHSSSMCGLPPETNKLENVRQPRLLLYCCVTKKRLSLTDKKDLKGFRLDNRW